MAENEKTYLTWEGLQAYDEEIKKVIDKGGEGSVVTMKEDTTQTDYAKVYEIFQGDNTKPENKVGTINVPKDLVVESGSVVVVTDEQAGTTGFPAKAGTYIKLVIANAKDQVIWVDVASLIENYTAAKDATEVQLAIDPMTREISASLTQDVKDAIVRANNSVQAVKATAAEGTDGTITISKWDAESKTLKDVEVEVKGLENGAFTKFTAITTDQIKSLFTA